MAQKTEQTGIEGIATAAPRLVHVETIGGVR